MKIRNVIYILTPLLCLLFFVVMPVYAQNNTDDDNVQSLGDILNPKDDMDGPITPKDMPTLYYKKCMAKKTLAFDKKEKDILCACTASNLEKTLTVKEFKNLYKSNVKGRDARGKVIAYAYTECMDFVIERKLYNDCMVSPIIQDITQGKSSICECSAKEYVKAINQQAATIIMQAIKYEPMTLNPLEHYFTQGNYASTADNYTRHCRSVMLYKKYN